MSDEKHSPSDAPNQTPIKENQAGLDDQSYDQIPHEEVRPELDKDSGQSRRA